MARKKISNMIKREHYRFGLNEHAVLFQLTADLSLFTRSAANLIFNHTVKLEANSYIIGIDTKSGTNDIGKDAIKEQRCSKDRTLEVVFIKANYVKVWSFEASN